MDASRILLSLPSDLAEIKRQLINQQHELKQIAINQKEKNKINLDETTKEVDETVHQNDYSNLGRTVIEVGQPKIVNFKKYKEDQSYYSTQTAPVQYPTKQPQKPRESKVRESREPKKEVENHTPTIYEFQRDESGALKVITSKDDSREKKMGTSNVPDVTSFHRPAMRGSSKKSSKKEKTENIENRKCPVCAYFFPGLSEHEFTDHVDRHFEDENSEFFELVGRVD